jgi:hypothetical protein
LARIRGELKTFESAAEDLDVLRPTFSGRYNAGRDVMPALGAEEAETPETRTPPSHQPGVFALQGRLTILTN